uniref:Cullin 7 n=1 Tax=Pygocentrus nattereri TaxID=42514 RepID=A0AAR2IGS5_PYGNA
MVGERRNGNLLVHLGPKQQAYPEELIRQRRTHDGQTEYLIRWSLSGVGGSGGSSSGESKTENILMWMSTEDVYANCPTLLGKRPLLEENERPSGQFPADVTFDEVELSDMKDDVKNLVERARKQMAKNSDFAISLTHTIHVLSAYASIGSLVGVFKETGALDLLMELLCNKERQTRRSAGKMLRALASHDAGSRAYVLLSLSQQDGIEQHMDFDNRYTLLELFAETTSSEEHGISFEGIHLPQIPGKLLFSLVKRYLCVTSLMDKLNTAGVESSSERQDPGPSSSSSTTSGHQSEQSRVQREFEYTMAMANLISELVRVMGWDRNRQPPLPTLTAAEGAEDLEEEANRRTVRSIFQPRFSASPTVVTASVTVASTPPKKKTGNGFKTRTDFATRSAYVEYVQDNLKSGMQVRMLEDYEEVSAGDEGEFRYSNDGSPPVQVYWNSISRTYWVHWHMVEILGSGSSGQAEKETQEKATSLTETLKLTTVSQTFFSKPPGGLYSLPYLIDSLHDDESTLTRAEWWEVLFFIKKLEPKQQQEVNNILRQNLDEQLDEVTLIQLSVSSEVARKILHYLKQTLQASCLGDLLCSHTFAKHYLRRGGASLEDEEMLTDGSLNPSGLSGQAISSSSAAPAASTCSASSSTSTMGSLNLSLICRDKVLKMLVEMIGSQPKQNAIIALLLTRSLMLKYEWRVSFATEGGVKAILSCMQEYPTCTRVQQIALAVSPLLMTFKESRSKNHSSLSSGTQMMLEIFASIGSATPEGSKGLLGAIPSAVDLMLNTSGCGLSVRNGLLVIIMLISNHKSLAEQLVACDVTAVLKKCLSAQRSETMLAIIALSHISNVHKLEKNGIDVHSCSYDHRPYFFFLIITVVLNRILNKFLDNYQEDLLPWHESIEPCLSSMTACINDRETVQQFIRFLYRLASLNKDYAVVMCRLGTKEALVKALDKHSTNLLMVTELRDLINDCEKYASLYKKMTTSVLAGCIQMVLGQIEEHRRNHQPINIPFFDVFLRNLCQGSSVELKEDKCWEKVEVSSNHHRTNKLTDKNPKTYWESNGCTGSHFINIYMHKGVIIRQLAVLVASEDSSYMPARIVVLGGDDPTNINTELNTVNVPPSASRVVLLENMTRFWSIIQIRIKRCQQGGIDTRVRGFEVLGPKPTFWPVFKEQLCCRTYLFYTTKAHTWCQEILGDKGQLLQLFNKLNSALRHEQMFADRFLPDAEAAEALGRTCWEALINPIVQSITVPDSPVLSPLAWLLSEYLENAESSKRYKTRAAIFNSRVRRLTHLLVHVDTKGKNKEASAATSSSSPSSAAKPKVKNTSSIAGIALCWQGVVQRQVKKFLDLTYNMPDFVERYKNMYLRLKNAMEELFGQQTAFVLALRQGFSAALLQLSILTAMHVSERFAQYIDHMIQESGVDSGNMETLNHLQQFLEPMLFLSGLELANTFEHFYRYYLGDRLLGQGKVWLESAVIEQISTCFPNRFPQQMLSNLTESEELQQEFHLYRLQQLDKKLQDIDEEHLCGFCGVQMMDEQLSEPDEESDVKVLVLSPRCWAISAPCYLEEPRKYFPQQLCSYLAEFSMYSLSNSKPRRLQWTWLGHAELRYGSCTLCVSTLQMYILLLFNQQEDISVDSLQQATGLSPSVLAHALKPLTSEKGILTHSGCSQDVVKGKFLCGMFWSYGSFYCYLLPKQTYLNVDEDAARTLERKRNYMYCLIVQIMKKEKEMHIDNLVFKVLFCWQRGKQEIGRSPSSVRFSCSTTDVLSCIMHVINKGYIRRNEDNPHIVEFLVEDPSTPQKGQAHFFSKLDLKKGSSSSKAVLFSMGRTMTQEEVKQLMQRTVQQVASTLSLDLDRAEHLLVHCKWNVDMLIQRYTDDPDSLVLAAGLKIRNPQPPPSPVTVCPVCLISRSGEIESAPTLCCMHYCCKSCWQEYLTARIEQNLVMNCNCPIMDCRAQPTSRFFYSILTDKDTIAKYENALLRGYVECCSNLTWCTNPQGCDQILCKENIGSMGTCSKCCWSSCFSCNFPEAHYPASCSHMSQWMDDGGYYEGMSMEAQSKHLAKLISKRCPSCQAQIEKNEGCLHMTCAKCNHGFCWRCLKPWKPTHKDYYNCSAMVSKAARQEKKFQDYNERCTFHNQAKDFAINLENKVSSINEALQMKSLTFVIDACKILAQARKVLAYSCVYSYYNQDTEKMDIMEQQTEALDLHTNALQILLEETLLQCTDLASCVRLLKPEHLNTGLELIRRIQERLVAILQHSTQVCSYPNSKLYISPSSDNNNYTGEDVGDEAEEDDEYDDEYVPEWHEDYDEEDADEDDFFSDDDESENLERDFSPFD